MRIDCDECALQHSDACGDCVVGHLLERWSGPVEVDHHQVNALEALAEVGLVPRLRLMPRAANE